MTDIAAMPGALALELNRLCMGKSLPKKPAAVESFAKGERNTALTREAGRLHRARLEPAALEAALQAINKQRCSPPLDAKEVAGIARSVSSYDNGPPLHTAEWPEPLAIKSDLPDAPEFVASELLPRALAEFVQDEADRMPCSPDYVAAALLVMLGSVIGARVGLKPKRKDDWIVTPNLYGGVVGDPSSRKTPALATVKRSLDGLEAKRAEAHNEALKLYAAQMAAFEAQQTALKGSMKSAAKGSGSESVMEQAVAAMSQLLPPEEPRKRRFVVNDSTVEALISILTHNPTGILVFRDELMGLLHSFERDGHEGDRALYLEGANGTGSFSSHRVGRGNEYIANLCLSVFGGVQPELLERYLSVLNNSLSNDGLIQRFQVLVYPEPVAWEWRDRYPVEGAREAVRDLFDDLADMEPLQRGALPANDFVRLPYFHFDDEAQAVFIEWSNELHNERIVNEPDPMLQQHLAKFEKLFGAVALILHLSEYRKGPIRIDSALRAALWCQYLEGHARRIYGLVETAKVKTAAMVGRRLADDKLKDGFTARDLADMGWSGIKTTADAMPVLAVLIDKGWLQSHVQDNQIGRPTTRYWINPRIRKEST